VIPPSFTYKRASSVEEALALAAEHGEDAKYLAGGHSLLPLMKLRFAAPEVLIDIGRIDGLSYITDQGTHVAIGALTRHHDVATSALLNADIPLLAHTAGEVGDPQVRHRGTIGGSVAHGDAASDLPASLLALEASFVIRGASGERTVPAAEFFKGIFETAVEPGELLTEVQVPKPAHPSAWSFQKFTKRAIDWAIVGVAVSGRNVALINMGSTPLRAAGVEQALAAGASPAEAAARAAEGTSPGSDIHASAGYREHLARVLVARALTEAAGRALLYLSRTGRRRLGSPPPVSGGQGWRGWPGTAPVASSRCFRYGARVCEYCCVRWS
jgi:carbon-monoxide dehydrogenase medium subunit